MYRGDSSKSVWRKHFVPLSMGSVLKSYVFLSSKYQPFNLKIIWFGFPFKYIYIVYLRRILEKKKKKKRRENWPMSSGSNGFFSSHKNGWRIRLWTPHPPSTQKKKKKETALNFVSYLWPIGFCNLFKCSLRWRRGVNVK